MLAACGDDLALGTERTALGANAMAADGRLAAAGAAEQLPGYSPISSCCSPLSDLGARLNVCSAPERGKSTRRLSCGVAGEGVLAAGFDRNRASAGRIPGCSVSALPVGRCRPGAVPAPQHADRPSPAPTS